MFLENGAFKPGLTAGKIVCETTKDYVAKFEKAALRVLRT